MNKEYFDKIMNDDIYEAIKLGIKEKFVEYCVDTFYSYETALKNIMSERKLQNKHKKFGSLSQDEKLKIINKFNIYRCSEQEFDDYMYLLLSVKLKGKMSNFLIYYMQTGELYK